MQNHYNLIYREEEREMIPQCLDQGVGMLPWSPLARGLLAGHAHASGERLTTRARTDPFLDSLYRPDLDIPVIDRVGRGRGRAGRLHRHRSRSRGSCTSRASRRRSSARRRLEHLEDALAAEALSLSDEEIARLEEPYVPHPVSGIEL